MKKFFLITIVSLLTLGFTINYVDAINNPFELSIPSEKPIIPDTSSMSPRAQMLAGLSASQVAC